MSLQTFFDEGKCPDCGAQDFRCWQDGGHDVALECRQCGARYGVQEAPFNFIERIGPPGDIPRRSAIVACAPLHLGLWRRMWNALCRS